MPNREEDRADTIGLGLRARHWNRPGLSHGTQDSPGLHLGAAGDVGEQDVLVRAARKKSSGFPQNLDFILSQKFDCGIRAFTGFD